MTATFLTTAAAKVLAPREVAVGARLPFLGHLDDVTLRTRDGLLVQTLHLAGFPFETAADDELNYRKAIRETVLRGAASSRLALYHHVVRRRVTPTFPPAPEDPFCAELDRRWQEQLASRRLYVNEIFLTLVLRPTQGGAGFVERLLKGPRVRDADLSRDLRELHATREAFAAALAPYGARTLGLYSGPGGVQRSEPAEFLGLLLNGDMRPVLNPSGDLSDAIATRRLSFGFDAMEFGPQAGGDGAFGAMVSLKDYPARTAPGLLDGVLRLPMEMVLTESFAFVDRQAALGRMGLALRRLKAAEDDAFSLRAELAQARDDVGAGRAAYGEHHLTILAKADSLEDLDFVVADVQSALAEAGAVAVREDVNLEPAFWAQFPGNFKFIARKGLISAGNFAGLASFHNHPTGQAEGNHWGPAIAVLETTAFGPYHFNFHQGDLGNFTCIGPSGSGKTVLLTFLLAQAERLKPRIAYFDKDRGAEPFIRAIGGRYDVLSPGEPTGFNPLALADTPLNRAFLVEWVAQLLTAEGGVLDAEDRAMIADAIDANFAQPPTHRRLRYLRELFRGARRPSAGDLASRLSAWCEGGDHAWLFDNPDDLLDIETRVLGFDMTKLLDSPIIRIPAMMYLFHRLEQRLDGNPAIFVVDEGWKVLDDPVFMRRIKDWEKTIRKRNGLVGFCTQSASDALDSRIASAIIEQAATQIFFPNARAKASDYIDGFGLSEHEFELVRSLPDTSRCFLIKRGDHSVVARLDLTGLTGELAVLAGTERAVRRLDALRAQVGDAPADWLPTFMEGRSAA
ncbi:VirB4 family type IV secretion/conjugal transfer ATPase [Phenylobacterium kunshanense]|uniref:Type IV secretion system protein virB4 n=1 Tax=Phenylobacterium kunshanense TaxID=1445034 RepID=A0A328BIR7_9CAUL|nr:VirB4 family type IV secretion system protein [Phenylobacterium kunshanense]RAK66555.1 VirB4 family type IV secretion/conjugal transfer ATPase [Phenylobacterium kunshanense]